jgi:iron complex outermembrane receptor protein
LYLKSEKIINCLPVINDGGIFITQNAIMRRILLLFAVLVQASIALAQQAQKDVTGKVTDVNGQPLSGVTVANKKSGASTVTSGQGVYNIRAKQGDVLSFTFISYADIDKTVGASSSINVVMQTSSAVLSDVVVVGYGKASRKALTSAITTIKPEDMNRGPITDVGRLLQGKVPGLNITASGDPNRRAAIILRGASTINSPGNPFFVIDGVPGADIALVAPDLW